MYCPKCKRNIPDKKAFRGEKCPICMSKLLYLGREQSTISPKVIRTFLSMKDRSKLPKKFEIKEYKNPIVETAHVEYEEIIRNDPNNWQAHYDLALVYYRQGKIEETLKLLKKAVILNKDFIEAYHKLSELYAKNQKYALAQEALKEILRLDRTDVNAWFNLGYIGIRLDNIELARNSFERVVRLDPDNNEAKDILSKLKKKREK